MPDEDSKPMTLTREDLYELVWSKPVTDLAKDFGISDVALAKRCRRLGIPLPGRGYWARLDAGQKPYRPKLPNRKPQWHDQSALTVGPLTDAYTPTQLTPIEDRSATTDDVSVAARIATLAIPANESLIHALPVVKRTALRRKHPRRSELSFERGERSGPVIALDVTADALERALLLSDRLIRAAQALGWTFDDPHTLTERQGRAVNASEGHGSIENAVDGAKPDVGCFLVEGEQVAFRIEERFREEPVEPTAAQLAREKRHYGYHAPRKISVATGALRAVRLDTYATYGHPDRRSWFDHKGKRVEDQLREILLGFFELALSIRDRRAKDEQEARKRQEEERRRKEWEAIQDANEKLIKQLETDAGAWHRARYLRRYVRAARRSLGSEVLRARFREQTVNFLDWAEAYVDQLDPLQGTLRTGEFDASSAYHYRTDLDRMKDAFGRLLGSEWPHAFKLGTKYMPKPESDRHWYAGQESVFEVEVPEAACDD